MSLDSLTFLSSPFDFFSFGAKAEFVCKCTIRFKEESKPMYLTALCLNLAQLKANMYSRYRIIQEKKTTLKLQLRLGPGLSRGQSERQKANNRNVNMSIFLCCQSVQFLAPGLKTHKHSYRACSTPNMDWAKNPVLTTISSHRSCQRF